MSATTPTKLLSFAGRSSSPPPPGKHVRGDSREGCLHDEGEEARRLRKRLPENAGRPGEPDGAADDVPHERAYGYYEAQNPAPARSAVDPVGRKGATGDVDEEQEPHVGCVFKILGGHEQVDQAHQRDQHHPRGTELAQTLKTSG